MNVIHTAITPKQLDYFNNLHDEFRLAYGNWASLITPYQDKVVVFFCDVDEEPNWLSMYGPGIFDFEGPLSIYFPFYWRGYKVCPE